MKNVNDKTFFKCLTIFLILTAEIQIDRRCNFTHLVFGLNLVETGVHFDHIVQFKDDHVRVGGHGLDFHDGPVVLEQLGFAPEPRDFRFGTSQQTALKYQSVTVILLPQLWLLREARSKVFGHTHCCVQTGRCSVAKKNNSFVLCVELLYLSI